MSDQQISTEQLIRHLREYGTTGMTWFAVEQIILKLQKVEKIEIEPTELEKRISLAIIECNRLIGSCNNTGFISPYSERTATRRSYEYIEQLLKGEY